MEFSLFLIVLAIVVSLLVLALNALLEAAGKRKTVRFGLLVLPVAIFFWNPVAAALTAAVLVLFLAGKDTALFRKHRTAVLTVFFLLFLAGMSLAYFKSIVQVWIDIDNLVINYVTPVSLLKNSRFAEVFFVAQYFRFLYPVLLSVVLFFLFDRSLSGHGESYWHRFFRKFDHRAVYPMMVLWTVYFVLDRLKSAGPLARLKDQGLWLNLALETAVYFAMLYAVYGALTVMTAFRRWKVRPAWSLGALFVIVVISGPVFLFTLTFLMGIGVSDIWMHYNKKKFKKAFSK